MTSVMIFISAYLIVPALPLQISPVTKFYLSKSANNLLRYFPDNSIICRNPFFVINISIKYFTKI